MWESQTERAPKTRHKKRQASNNGNTNFHQQRNRNSKEDRSPDLLESRKPPATDGRESDFAMIRKAIFGGMVQLFFFRQNLNLEAISFRTTLHLIYGGISDSVPKFPFSF